MRARSISRSLLLSSTSGIRFCLWDAKKLMKIFTCCAFGRKGEKRILHQFLYFQGFSFKGKEFRIGNKNIPKFFYHLYFCVCGKPGIGKIAYDQVHLPVFQKLHAAHGGAVGDLDPHSRIILMKALQIVNQKVPADGIACPDPQLPLKSVFLKKLCLPLGKHFQGRFDMLEKYFSLRGKGNLLGASEKQFPSQLFFQSLDSLAYCRLGNKKLLGSFRETESDCYMIKTLYNS